MSWLKSSFNVIKNIQVVENYLILLNLTQCVNIETSQSDSLPNLSLKLNHTRVVST
jgi:hypothetical protein